MEEWGLDQNEPQPAPDEEAELEVSRLLARTDALIQISRQERERLGKGQDQFEEETGLLEFPLP